MEISIFIRIIASYLVGSISGSMIIGRFRGVDIRTIGSGNAGGTNAFRTQGIIFAVAVVIIDVMKGFASTYYISGDYGLGGSLGIICGVAAVLGHVYPIYYNFQGGKGAGTMMGILIPLFPEGLLIILCVWGGVLVLSGYVGLSTMVAGIAFPISAYLRYPQGLESPLGYFSIGIALFLIFTHRSNISRMLSGNENRFDKIRLFRKKF